jgi:hypothetical protein
MSSIWNTNYSEGITNIPQYPPQAFPTNQTALVQQYDFASNGTNDYYNYYRCRNCDTNLTTNTPSSQYQKQKLIQNTVRIDSSQYTMNLGSLASYQMPKKKNGSVPWNQMSDRAEPSVQKANGNGGNTIGSSSTRHSITRLRPGSMSPGGIGCDIKHNSYDRYLNRLKGKAPLRRGIIPPNFGQEEIPFNRANPIYGGKIMKTSIVTGCNCPIETKQKNYQKLYQNNPNQDYNFNVPYQFAIGQKIFANINGVQTPATITANLGNGNFTIQIASSGETMNMNQTNFLIYYNCASHIGYIAGGPYAGIGTGPVNQTQSQGGNFVDQYIRDPGRVIACQKVAGTKSNISNTMRFFPELGNVDAVNGIPNSLALLVDNGIRYTNGVANPVIL